MLSNRLAPRMKDLADRIPARVAPRLPYHSPDRPIGKVDLFSLVLGDFLVNFSVTTGKDADRLLGIHSQASSGRIPRCRCFWSGPLRTVNICSLICNQALRRPFAIRENFRACARYSIHAPAASNLSHSSICSVSL